MDRWESRGGKGQRREEKRRGEERREEKKRRREKREDQRRERVRRKKMQVRENVGKSRNTVFSMTCGSAKAAGAEPSGQMRDEKLHAVMARSTFGSQNVQKTPTSEHFCKLRCRKKVHAVVARGTFRSQEC